MSAGRATTFPLAKTTRTQLLNIILLNREEFVVSCITLLVSRDRTLESS